MSQPRVSPLIAWSLLSPSASAQFHPQSYRSLAGSAAETSLWAWAQSQLLLLSQVQNPADSSSPFCGFESARTMNKEKKIHTGFYKITYFFASSLKAPISMQHLWTGLHAYNQKAFPRSHTSAVTWSQLWDRWTLGAFGHNLQTTIKL